MREALSAKSNEIFKRHIRKFIISLIIGISSLGLMVYTHNLGERLDSKFSDEHWNDIEELEGVLVSVNVVGNTKMIGKVQDIVKSIDIIGKVEINGKKRNVNLKHITKDYRGYSLKKKDLYEIQETNGGYMAGDIIDFYGYKTSYATDKNYLISRVSGSRLSSKASWIFGILGVIAEYIAYTQIKEEYDWRKKQSKQKKEQKRYDI